MDAIRIQADFILASTDKLLHPGQVVVQRGRLLSVTNDISERPDINLGECVILPGLINAHTHLEFSDLSQPLPAGKNFPAWISEVISYRRQLESRLDEQQLVAARRAAILTGLAESLLTGTSRLADIVSYPWQPDDLPVWKTLNENFGQQLLERSVTNRDRVSDVTREAWQEHLNPGLIPIVSALAEMIGLTPERSQATSAWASQLVEQGPGTSETLSEVGASPHAPYSILMPGTFEVVQRFSAETLVAMHIAESREELDFIQTRTGPFRDSLDAIGIPIPPTIPTIQDCIQLIARHKHALLVHGNYLSPSQIELAASKKTITAVYCPRTHAHFGHESYPLSSICKHGLPVIFGTDSRASNPDLNLWSEVVAARSRHTDLSPQSAFAAVTIASAKALGIEATVGSVETGKLAALNVVPCRTGWTSRNLLEEMTSTKLNCVPLAVFLNNLPPGKVINFTSDPTPPI